MVLVLQVGTAGNIKTNFKNNSTFGVIVAIYSRKVDRKYHEACMEIMLSKREGCYEISIYNLKKFQSLD